MESRYGASNASLVIAERSRSTSRRASFTISSAADSSTSGIARALTASALALDPFESTDSASESAMELRGTKRTLAACPRKIVIER